MGKQRELFEEDIERNSLPLANTPASGSQHAAQLSPRAAPPAECHEARGKNRVYLTSEVCKFTLKHINLLSQRKKS